MDYYRVLGLDPLLQLNLNELQQLFYARSRELHPDRFARARGPRQEWPARGGRETAHVARDSTAATLRGALSISRNCVPAPADVQT